MVKVGRPYISLPICSCYGIFSRLIGQLVRNEDFGFHWRYEKEQFTYLCFVDDLMIFYRAEVGMISLIENCIDQFWLVSSLSPNHDNNNMFLCGVEYNTKIWLLDVIDYKEGKLLVRYLSVPLITTKLTSPDCLILVDRVMAKAKSLMNCTLSYAGKI
jgi:hypothetical protein